MNQCNQHRWLLDTDRYSRPEIPQGTVEEPVQEWEQVLVREPDHPGSFPHMMQCTLQTYRPSIDQCICPECLQGMAGALVLVTVLVMALVLVLVLYIQHRTNPHKPCTPPKSWQDIAQYTCSECHQDKDPQELALVPDLVAALATVSVVELVLVHLDNLLDKTKCIPHKLPQGTGQCNWPKIHQDKAAAMAEVWVVVSAVEWVPVHLGSLPDKMKCTLRNFLLGTEQCKWPKIHQDKVAAMVEAWVLASVHLDNLLGKMRCTLQMHPQGTAQHMWPDFHLDMVVEPVSELGLELGSENRHTPVRIC